MKLHSFRSKTTASIPRFQGNLQSSLFENTLFKAADTFFNLKNTAQSKVQKRFLQGKPNVLKKTTGKILNWFSKTLLDHDFRHVAAVPKVGRIIMEPALGAFMIMSFGFMIGGRLVHALHRAIGGDRRELWDILRRDIPTVAIVIFGLPIVTKILGKKLQNWKGIQLIRDNQMLAYSELENMYRMLTPSRLRDILRNPVNHQGVRKALRHTLKNRNLSPGIKSNLIQFQHAIEAAIRGAHNPMDLNKATQKAFSLLRQLESKRIIALNKAKQTGLAVNRSIIEKFTNLFHAKVPDFKDIFVNYAKRSRVWNDAVAFGIIVGLLGFGVTWFNQWITEREYEKLKAQQTQGVSPVNQNPFSHTPTFQGNNSTLETTHSPFLR